MVDADSIVELLSAYLKQYKFTFNYSFQHLQSMVSIIQNTFGRFFLHIFIITSIVHSPQVLIYF
jgi:hypothetical protein